MMEGIDLIKRLCDEVEIVHELVEIVHELCCIGDQLNASGNSEVAVTSRVRIVWVRFRKSVELLLESEFPLKMKEKAH